MTDSPGIRIGVRDIAALSLNWAKTVLIPAPSLNVQALVLEYGSHSLQVLTSIFRTASQLIAASRVRAERCKITIVSGGHISIVDQDGAVGR